MSRRMTRDDAREILRACGTDGRHAADFHALTSDQVERVIAQADAYGYRKPKNANGSRARYFYSFLQRVAGVWK